MQDSPGRPAVAVLLPGSGSDHLFVASAFAQPLAMLGIRLIAPPPVAGSGVVHALDDALCLAAQEHADGNPGGVLVGGVSLGAHVAAGWAVRNPGRCAGLLLALPGWLGSPAGAPAALAALASADAVRRDGLDRTLAQVRATIGSTPSQRWLADELDRAWRGYGDALADSLRAAAAATAPTADELRGLAPPAGIVALSDDPLHPATVAQQWADALPRAAVVTTCLRAVGRDRAALGRAAVLAWLRAAHAEPDVRSRGAVPSFAQNQALVGG